jgi:hypothetical protein
MHLEPQAQDAERRSATNDGQRNSILYSIAISLKRLADAAEKGINVNADVRPGS